MHEYSIVQALLERVEQEVAAYREPRIQGLRVRIGELSGVETDLLVKAYEIFREPTPCRLAELFIQPVPARWECPSCGWEIAARGLLRCPSCDRPARLVAGDEIVLDRIEMEVADV